MQLTTNRLLLALVLVLGTTLVSPGFSVASQPALAFQEEPAPDGSSADEVGAAAEEAPAAEQTAPAPGGGPGSDQPWYQWRNDVDAAHQLFAMMEYQSFWEKRTAALEDPYIDNELNLTGVMAGEPLQKERDFLHTLQAKGQAQ